MSDLSPKQIAELIYQYERVLTQIDRGSLMLSPRLLKRVKDTITALAQVKELEDPSWEQFINLTTQWLEKYPPNIFDGSSGDPGPLFVVALRNALAALQENEL